MPHESAIDDAARPPAAESAAFARRPLALRSFACISIVAFIVLALRFSPNWFEFHHQLREAKSQDPSHARDAVIENTFLKGWPARGYYVSLQIADLSADIPDPHHKIVRWRLLFPTLGHALHLSPWTTLALGPVGCFVLVATLAAIALTYGEANGKYPWYFAGFVIAGAATAPFFTSIGWLGYFDAWLGVALLAVAFARTRWWVLLACLLAPWIDERFTVGLPLALTVRSFVFDSYARRWSWFKAEAALPLVLTAAYAAFRVYLGGHGGSQTVGGYLRAFVLGAQISNAQRIFGAWSGLRISWLFVVAAVISAATYKTAGSRSRSLLLAVMLMLTGAIALLTAEDMSRAMVLLLPAVPLGWIGVSRLAFWHLLHLNTVAGAAALVLPASHVIGNMRYPVDTPWAASIPLVTAENDLGLAYEKGDGVPRDQQLSTQWYRRAADSGFYLAQFSLGFRCATGLGTPKNVGEAAVWYRKSAEHGFGIAEYGLAALYSQGNGVPHDEARAFAWFLRSAEHGVNDAQKNVGAMYAIGQGVSQNLVEAYAWTAISARAGNSEAGVNLADIERHMSAAQVQAAKQLAAERARAIERRIVHY